MISDSNILRNIERQPRQTAGYKQLVRELGARGNDRRELSEHLRNLVSRGELVEADGDRYAIPKASPGKNLVTGRLSMHRDGYGFVIPDSTELREKISGDIYINPNGMDAAMHGDRVLVELGTIRADGRAEGRIVRSLERAHPTVVGIFHYGPRYNYVHPIDEKVTQDIIIPPGQEIPGTAEGQAQPRPTDSALTSSKGPRSTRF